MKSLVSRCVAAVALVATASCRSGSAPGHGSGGAGAGDRATTAVVGSASILVGQRVEIDVSSSGGAPDAQFMLEIGGQAKTVWQAAGSFSVYFESPGTQVIVGHVRSSAGRVASAPINVVVLPGDVSVESDRDAVTVSVPQSIVFHVPVGDASKVSSVTMSDTTYHRDYPMYDDGDPAHGDAAAGDGVYSCKVNETYPPGAVAFQGNLVLSGNAARTRYINIPAVTSSSDADVAAVVQDIGAIDALIGAMAGGITIPDFIDHFPTSVPGAQAIESVGKSDGYLMVRFTTGHNHLIEFVGEGISGTLAGAVPFIKAFGGYVARFTSPVSSTVPPPVSNAVYVENYHAIIYSAAKSIWTQGVYTDPGEAAYDALSADPRFQPANVKWLQDADVTLDSMISNRWSDYGIVVYSGHGLSDEVGDIALGEPVSAETTQKHNDALLSGYIGTVRLVEYKTSQPVVTTVPGDWLPTSTYYVSSAWLGRNNPVNQAGTFYYAASCFGGTSIEKISNPNSNPNLHYNSAFFGYSDLVGVPFGGSKTATLFNNLLAGKPLKDSYDPSWNVSVGGTASTPVVIGNPNLIIKTICAAPAGVDGASAPCYSGPPQSLGVGICAAGTMLCTGGVWAPCQGEVMMQAEVCDGLDNDCDGTVDNNIPSVPCAPPNASASTVYGGTSPCQMGHTECSGGQTVCSGGVGPTDEVPDGIDNDCDGIVDNGYMPGCYVGYQPIVQIMDPRDAKTYPVTQIGAQCWMTQDINYDPSPNGSGACCDPPFMCTYFDPFPVGQPCSWRFYTWPTAMADLCPPGWHLPTQAEVKALLSVEFDPYVGQQSLPPLFTCGAGEFCSSKNGGLGGGSWMLNGIYGTAWTSTVDAMSQYPLGLDTLYQGGSSFGASITTWGPQIAAFSVRCTK